MSIPAAQLFQTSQLKKRSAEESKPPKYYINKVVEEQKKPIAKAKTNSRNVAYNRSRRVPVK